jgi:hypothetical protein
MLFYNIFADYPQLSRPKTTGHVARRRTVMGKITSSNALAHFLFEQMRVRWQVSPRPILTMQKVSNTFSRREYTVPVWLWTITIFIVDETGQPIEGRVMREQRRLDHQPGEDAVIRLFEDYAFITSNIWDRGHSRCYGYFRWKLNDDNKLPDREAMNLYKSEKVTILAVQALLGAEGFRQLIRAELS